MQQGGGAFLFLNNRYFPPQQWGSSQQSTSYKSSHILGSKSITGSPLHQFKTDSPHATHACQNGAPATLTPICCTAFGIVINKIIPKAMKAMDMRFHWLHDCKQQQLFQFYWQRGKTNFMDCPAKHHAAAHHKHI